MNRFLSLIFLVVLIEFAHARPRKFYRDYKRSPVYASYDDDSLALYDDVEKPAYHDNFDRPRMPTGGFCCGGWGAGRGPVGQMRPWQGPPNFIGSQNFPSVTHGHPFDFPQDPFAPIDQNNPFGGPGGFPGFNPNEPFITAPNGYQNSFGPRPFGFNDQFDSRKFYGPSYRSFGQPDFGNWPVDSNINRFDPLNDIARHPPKSSSSEQQEMGQGVDSTTPASPLKFDPETGLLIDMTNPLGQKFMDSVEGGFDRNSHFKSGELGQDLTKGQKGDLTNGGKFEHEESD